jgi:hypothetical protein
VSKRVENLRVAQAEEVETDLCEDSEEADIWMWWKKLGESNFGVLRVTFAFTGVGMKSHNMAKTAQSSIL